MRIMQKDQQKTVFDNSNNQSSNMFIQQKLQQNGVGILSNNQLDTMINHQLNQLLNNPE